MTKTEITEDLMEVLFTEIKRGVPYKYACPIAGISQHTFYKWRKLGEEEPEDSDSIYRKFYDEFVKARALAIAYRVEGIRKAGEGGQWQAHAWWLERVANKEFGRRSVIDANVEANVKQVNLAELFSEEELDKIINEEE